MGLTHPCSELVRLVLWEHVKVYGADFSMMGGQEVLGEIVSQVYGTLAPEDFELALVDSVLNPIVAHIHHFHVPLFNGVIGNAGSHAVVHDDDGRGLQMPHLSKGCVNEAGFLAVDEGSSNLCFCGQGDNNVDDLADDVDRSIWWW